MHVLQARNDLVITHIPIQRSNLLIKNAGLFISFAAMRKIKMPGSSSYLQLFLREVKLTCRVDIITCIEEDPTFTVCILALHFLLSNNRQVSTILILVKRNRSKNGYDIINWYNSGLFTQHCKKTGFKIRTTQSYTQDENLSKGILQHCQGL